MLAPILFSIVVFIAVILACVAVYWFWQRKESIKHQSQRFEQAINIRASGYSEATPEQVIETEDTVQTDIRRDLRVSSMPWLNSLLSKYFKIRSRSLMILIEQSGLKIKVGEFLIFAFLLGLIGSFIVHLIFHIPLIGFVISIIPFGLLHFLKQQRIETFVKQLPQALDLLSSDLRAGLDVQAGLKHLSEEFSAPLGEEFAKVVVEINLGLPLSEALNNLAARVNTMDVQILCTGIIINKELGGNLSELIQNIGATVRERFQLKGMIKALTAENQMAAIMLVVLPIGLFIILNVLAPETYNSFAKDPQGQMVLIGCLVSMAVGYLLIKKITHLEV